MSKSYNNLEKKIADLFSKFPFVKSILKRAYTVVMYLIYYDNSSYKCEKKISTLSNIDGETFFGYYDKYPQNGKYILTHQTSLNTHKKPPSKTYINIIVIDNKDSNRIVSKVKTESFNWQQGARAHWIDKDNFIYNDFSTRESKFISKVYSVNKNGIIKEYDKPVQDSFENQYFLSLNYKRLHTLRPDYGYNNLGVMSEDELKNLDNDGLWFVDMNTGKSRLMHPLSEIVNIKMESFYTESIHWVNHVMISPNGEKFIFLHRYLFQRKRYSRLLISDIKHNKLRLISNYGMVSHCCWVDNNFIIGFLKGPDNRDAFWKINVTTGEHETLDSAGLDKYGDGHPTYMGNALIFDSYPDKGRFQHLYKCNFNSQRVEKIGSFSVPLKYFGETRCDLHPRVSKNSNLLFFDSAHLGKRKLCYVEMENKNLEDNI